MLMMMMTSFSYHCRCDTVDKLKMKFPEMEREIRDASNFKDFYQFTFNYAKNPGQKGLGNVCILCN